MDVFDERTDNKTGDESENEDQEIQTKNGHVIYVPKDFTSNDKDETDEDEYHDFLLDHTEDAVRKHLDLMKAVGELEDNYESFKEKQNVLNYVRYDFQTQLLKTYDIARKWNNDSKLNDFETEADELEDEKPLDAMRKVLLKHSDTLDSCIKDAYTNLKTEEVDEEDSDDEHAMKINGY